MPPDGAKPQIKPLKTISHPPDRLRRLVSWAALAVMAVGPVIAVLVAWRMTQARSSGAAVEAARGDLLAYLAYVAVLAAVICWTLHRAIQRRRARHQGARLHLRLVSMFVLSALAPTVLVAGFAVATLQFGLEGWFSSQIQRVIGNSLSVAESYAEEHRASIRSDALNMASDLNRASAFGMELGRLGELVRQQSYIRELKEAFVLDGDGEILARGEYSYLFNMEPPSEADFADARAGAVVVQADPHANEIRALIRLRGLIDAFLYITRPIEGEVLKLLDGGRETVALYDRLAEDRSTIFTDFALLYAGFATLVLLAASWLGLWFAERLARPISRLAETAEQVGRGDLSYRVKVPKSGDEIALLARAFNRMTSDLQSQRAELIEAHGESEARRRFIETVLSSVSAGVMGLDRQGRVELTNDAAAQMLGVAREALQGQTLSEAVTALSPLLARAGEGGAAQQQVALSVEGRPRELLARIAPRETGAGEVDGAVLTIDDLSDLAAAQRMAAWGDVARRVAHEIKNPLTPIQLSADRLKAKFRKLAEEERAALDQYADVIIRQAGDIRRMVDEFSRFARMPEPQKKPEDLRDILSGAVLLQREGAEGVAFSLETPDAPVCAPCDRGLINQAVTNLLKNAAEAAQARRDAAPEGPPCEVRAALRAEGRRALIEIADNGSGLPAKDRARLTEPYVTTRAKGTGLGLAIVKKIAEQHGGALELLDAPPFHEGAPAGALIRICLPLAAGEQGAEQAA